MAFQVIILPRAELEIEASAAWWSTNRSAEQATAWIEGFRAALRRLAQNPERWGLAPESTNVGRELRELTYGLNRSKTHRAVFEIHSNKVIVYAIRHLAQDSLTANDF